MRALRRRIVAIAVFASLSAAAAWAEPEPAAGTSGDASDMAAFVAKSAGIERGMGLVLCETDGRLTAALSKAGGTYIHGCTWDAKAVKAARERLAAAGVAERAAIALIEVDHLPYADNLINWGRLPGVGRASHRHRRGRARADSRRNGHPRQRRQPRGHCRHRGQVQAGRRQAGQGARPQGLGAVHQAGQPGLRHLDAEPRRAGPELCQQRQGGRAVGGNPLDRRAAMGGALHHLPGARVGGGGGCITWRTGAASGGTQTWLVGRDAYNGLDLWRVPSGPVWTKKLEGADNTLACDDRYVYVVEENILVARDSQTGKLARKFQTDFPLKVVTALSGVVIASGKTTAVALDAETGKTVWKRAVVAHPAAADGVAYVFSGAELEAIDLATGKSKWKISPASATGVPIVFCKAGIIYISHTPSYKPMAQLAAYDSKDGSLLWSQASPKGGYGTLPYADSVVLLERDNGSKGDNVYVRTLDARTGQPKREFQAKGLVAGKCYPSKGSANFLLYSNSWYLDRKSGETSGLDTLRSPCQLGQMPANGLTYFLPQHCNCRVFLRGMIAMSAHGTRQWLPKDDPTPQAQLTGVPPTSAPAAGAEDWLDLPSRHSPVELDQREAGRADRPAVDGEARHFAADPAGDRQRHPVRGRTGNAPGHRPRCRHR